MRKMKLIRNISSSLIVASVLALNPIGVSAEWKEDHIGVWYSEGSSWAVGWRQIEGNWYYFNEKGYMLKNRDINGWYLDEKGIGRECMQAEGFEMDRSTGTIGKYISGDVYFSPSSTKNVDLTVPKEIHDVEVKSIGYNAFDQCINLASITLPESMTSIGDYAFDNCVNLKSILSLDNVTSIGSGAFEGCISLENITLPKGITSISEKTFFHCEKLSSVTIPDSVTSIEDYAFDSCYSLKEITIPDKVTEIGRSSFWGCNDAVFYVGNEKIKQLILDSDSNINSDKIIVK